MSDVDDFQSKLKVLHDDYAAHLPEKLEQIEQAWSRLPRREWDDAGFQSLHRMVHSLTGSGKIYGFASLSDVASNLEECLNLLAQKKAIPGAEQRNRIQIFLHDLRRAMTQVV